MQTEVHYNKSHKNRKRTLSDILLIQQYYSDKDIVMIYANQVEQAEPGNWETGIIQIRQYIIKENFNIFMKIDILDKILFTDGQILFLADVIEIYDDGFKIKKCMPILEIKELNENLRSEVESAIRKKKTLSIIYNKEDIYNLSNGLVLIDEELHINIHTEAENYYLNDLTDLLSGIRELLSYEESFDAYIKIKLCSPGFIILTITSGIEFITNNAIGIALLMCIIFGGELTIGGHTVSSPSIVKGIRYLINAKKIKQDKAIDREYKEEQLKGIKLDNIKKELDISNHEKDIEIINNSIVKLKKVRDKMEIKKGNENKTYIRALNEIINKLEKTQ